MTITVANVSTNTTAGATTLTLSFTGVVAGSTLTIAIAQSAASSGRTYSVADNVNGSWGAADAAITGTNASNRHAEIFSFAGSASGNLTATVTVSLSAAFTIGGLEILASSGATNDTDAVDATTSTTLHSSQSTGFNPAAGSLVLAVIAPTGSVGSPDTADSDYTTIAKTPTAGALGYIGYRIVGGSALTDERMSWSVTTTRPSVGASVAFSESVAASSNPSNLLLMGVG